MWSFHVGEREDFKRWWVSINTVYGGWGLWGGMQWKSEWKLWISMNSMTLKRFHYYQGACCYRWILKQAGKGHAKYWGIQSGGKETTKVINYRYLALWPQFLVSESLPLYPHGYHSSRIITYLCLGHYTRPLLDIPLQELPSFCVTIFYSDDQSFQPPNFSWSDSD